MESFSHNAGLLQRLISLICLYARGVWELHRLTRETVLDWLSKRREADGIVSSTQKRRPEKRRGGGSALYIEDGEFERDERGGWPSRRGDDGDYDGAGPGPGSGERRGKNDTSYGGGEENVLMSLMSDVSSAPRDKTASQQQPAQVINRYRTYMTSGTITYHVILLHFQVILLHFQNFQKLFLMMK